MPEPGDHGVARAIERRGVSRVARDLERPAARARIALATSVTSAVRRPIGATSAPASASPSARARPMPLVPPTTTAVRPVRIE